MNEVYEQAQELTQAGYWVIPVKNYNKGYFTTGWQHEQFPLVPDMTGLDIKTNVPIEGTNLYPLVIDIDIFDDTKKRRMYNEITGYLDTDKLYVESTASGGIHIVCLADCKDSSNRNFKMQERNCNARHGAAVELFFGGYRQVMVAPSMATNKRGEIAQYRQISKIGLGDIHNLHVMDMDQYVGLKSLLTSLSTEYRNQAYPHQHRVGDDARDAIKAAYHALKAQGYQTAPLVNGNKHSLLRWDNVRDTDFDVDELTGIRLRLGEQADKTYLCVYDYDKLSDEYSQQLEEYLSTMPDCYSERSVSGGFHVIFKTDSNPDVHGSRMFPKIDDSTARHGYLELLYTNQQAVNIASTVSFVNKWDFPGEPVYGASHVIAGDILNLPKTPVNEVREYITGFEGNRRPKVSGTQNNTPLKSKEIELATAHVHEYAYLSDINKAIKLAFPMPDTLLNFLNVSDYIVCDDKGYIRFSSLLADDGNNPDALLYLNNDQKNKNLWSGYSVQDFHYDGNVMSFAVYLALADIDLFKKLMTKIGFDDSFEHSPIQMEYKGNTIELECDSYPDPDEVLTIIQNLQNNNPNGQQQIIVITAPTGTGKTEMFYRLAALQKLKLIIALSYTGQVIQAKAKYTIPGIMGGMCENDTQVPKGSVYCTYDKASWLLNQNLKDYVLVIDEYHNMVNHSKFRGPALGNLKKLEEKCQTVIYMTATAEYINYKHVDLMVQIKPKNITVKHADVVKYESNKLTKMINFIIDNHKADTISVVYVRDISMLEQIQYIINKKCKSLDVQMVHSKIKDDSQVYKNVTERECLVGNGMFQSGGILLLTNLLVDGVNINDTNINCLYLLDIKSTTDLIQYPSRFRKGFEKYYIVVSGKTPEYAVFNRSRQQWANIYYNVAMKYQRAYQNIKQTFNMSAGNVLDKEKSKINLPECYKFLDDNGNINEALIMRKVQQIEASRMSWNVDEIKKYMMDNAYNYDVIDTNQTLKITTFKPKDVDLELKSYKSEIEKDAARVKAILTHGKYKIQCTEMILDYIKVNKQDFEVLYNKWNISNHKTTKRYKKYLINKKCKEILWRYCVGLDLETKNPILLVDERHSRQDVRNIQKTVRNLRAEASGIEFKKDDKYLRYHVLREFVRDMKNTQTTDKVNLTSDDLKSYIKFINEKVGMIYQHDNIRKVADELKIIFDVEKNKAFYTIGDEWSLDNVRGVDFTI